MSGKYCKENNKKLYIFVYVNKISTLTMIQIITSSVKYSIVECIMSQTLGSHSFYN